MRSLTALLVSAALLSVAPHAAGASPRSPLAEPMQALATAVAHADTDGILAARAEFAALVADDPGAPRKQYGLAFADWRAVPMLGKARDAEARKLCKEGIAACDRALAADPKFADALALRAGLQGLAFAFLPGAGMSLGPEIIEQNARARVLAPDNPRVQLLSALSVLHEPENIGGGPKAANAGFVRAISLFEAERAADSTGSASASGIIWGREDAYLWSGRCRAALGDWAGARARYREVLAIEPEYTWVKRVLLPEAEGHLSQGAAK